MGEDMNGREPLTGWVLALVEGRFLVGRRHVSDTSGLLTLGPVYELRSDFIPLPAEVAPGKVAMVPQMVRQLVPLALCVSWDSVLLPECCVSIPLTALSETDQKEIAQMIAHVREGIRRAETQQRSGIVIPGGP
jgi:hypothetical protein